MILGLLDSLSARRIRRVSKNWNKLLSKSIRVIYVSPGQYHYFEHAPRIDLKHPPKPPTAGLPATKIHPNAKDGDYATLSDALKDAAPGDRYAGNNVKMLILSLS